MKLKGQEMGLQLANLASQIKLNESQANKNNAEANKTAGVDTELAKTSIENLISQTKNEKDRNALIWADKGFKEAAADMQKASAKLASGQNAKIGYEINQIKKSLDKMDLDMKGIGLDNELKRRVMGSLIRETWKYGFIFIGQYVTGKTINYITKYMYKKDEKHPTFTGKVLCSAGIGNQYTTRADAKNNKYKGEDTKETYKYLKIGDRWRAKTNKPLIFAQIIIVLSLRRIS